MKWRNKINSIEEKINLKLSTIDSDLAGAEISIGAQLNQIQKEFEDMQGRMGTDSDFSNSEALSKLDSEVKELEKLVAKRRKEVG